MQSFGKETWMEEKIKWLEIDREIPLKWRWIYKLDSSGSLQGQVIEKCK
jgi:hypothetical protein